jgi:hypothetical protein
MKKAAGIAGLFLALFLGSVTAQARTRYSFGLGVGPAVPYYYYPAYPPNYPGYYAYPYSYDYYYPSYRTYVVPRYYGNGGYRYYDARPGRGLRDGRSSERSRSGRWR